MSRIGLMPIQVPQGVIVSVENNTLKVKGSKGELTQTFVPVVDFSIDDGQVMVTRKNELKATKAMHGLYRSLLNNMVLGVSTGFSKTLMINGVGYRAELKGKILVLNLGYSNQIEYMIPDGIDITLDGTTKITVSGIDKELIGKVASEIRKMRPPEPYKGKGIRYENENVRRKTGKSGVK